MRGFASFQRLRGQVEAWLVSVSGFWLICEIKIILNHWLFSLPTSFFTPHFLGADCWSRTIKKWQLLGVSLITKRHRVESTNFLQTAALGRLRVLSDEDDYRFVLTLTLTTDKSIRRPQYIFYSGCWMGIRAVCWGVFGLTSSAYVLKTRGDDRRRWILICDPYCIGLATLPAAIQVHPKLKCSASR